MYEKQIRSLARQIAKLRQNSKSPRYPQELWDQILELRPHFTLAELSQQLGISPSNLQRKMSPPNGKAKSPKARPSATLIPIPSSGPSPDHNISRPPLFEMELPSGAKIRVFA